MFYSKTVGDMPDRPWGAARNPSAGYRASLSQTPRSPNPLNWGTGGWKSGEGSKKSTFQISD